MELNITKVSCIGEVCLICWLKGVVSDTSEVCLAVLNVVLREIPLMLGDVKACIELLVNSGGCVFSKRLSEDVLSLNTRHKALIAWYVLGF